MITIEMENGKKIRLILREIPLDKSRCFHETDQTEKSRPEPYQNRTRPVGHVC